MERLYPDKKYIFNDKIENWEPIREKTLREAKGILHLVDEQSGELAEAEILFLYSTLTYTGYNCRGIVKIGNDIGSAFVDTSFDCGQVSFLKNDGLFNPDLFKQKIIEIITDLDDDCRYSEATHVQHDYYYDHTELMKTLIKQYHAKQRRNSNPDIPYTEHLYGVASVLNTISKHYNEIPGYKLQSMIWAALGHDLLEDTNIQEEVISSVAGYDTLRMIKELTNPNDDAHTDEYMRRIASGSEEARIIKYADLIENTSSFCYALHEPNIDNPVQRAKEFYLPILKKTTDVLAKTLFNSYPKTAEAVRMTLKVYTDLLINRIDLLNRNEVLSHE